MIAMKDIKLAEVILGTTKSKRKKVPSLRTKLLVRSKGKCERCNRPLKGLTLHLHHINGDGRDNKMSNLLVLCPNCHSKTRTYKKPQTNPVPKDVWGIKPSFF